MYNKIILIGRLTKDPELRSTTSGRSVASFRLAVDRGMTNAQGEKETDFIDVVVWDKQAETVQRYCQKGKLVLVDGRLQMRQYDAQDGTRRTVYEVVAQSVRFLPDGRGQAADPGFGTDPGAGEAPRRAPQPPSQRSAAGGTASSTFGSEFNPDDDDVPF